MTWANRFSLFLVVTFASAGFLSPSEVSAQGRGDRGGLLSLLARDEVRLEIGLTPEQAAALDELRAKARPERESSDQFFERLRAAETEEQRNAIRAEQTALGNKLWQEAEDGVRKILRPEQISHLAMRMIKDRGPAALYDPSVRQQLELTTEQNAALEDVLRQREAAARSLGPASRDQFQAFRQEWDAKALAVLTEQQRSQWDAAAAMKEDDPSERDPVSSGSSDIAASRSAVQQPPTVRNDSPPTPEAAAPAETPRSDGVVASFGPSSQAGQPGTVPNQEQPLLTFNFRYAPWSEVLTLFADYANLTLDLTDVPPGTFNYIDNRKYTPTEAIDVLNGYLLQRGYYLIRRDHFLVCVNVDDGIPPNLIPNITAEELRDRGQNELLNVVFPIESVPATNVAREVELLLGPQGKVVPLSTSNSLVVTDIGSNLRRIERLLAAVSAAGPGDQFFKAYPLTHLDPLDAESIVKSQLGLASGVRNVSDAYDDWRRSRERESDRSRDSRSSSSTPSSSASTTPKVTPDERTGSLLVTATAAQHRIVEELLKVTDVPATGRGERRRSGESYLQVYQLRRSDPDEVVKTIDVLMPGVVVNHDDRARKVHIFASEAVHEEVDRLIRKLDGEGSGTSTAAVTVINLSTLDPYGAAATIRSLFAGDGDDAPIVEADSFGRRLLVRGTADQVDQVKTLLAQLGEDGSGRAGGNYSSGPVRTIPLGGRDPEEMIPLLQRLWETTGDSPLRVVPSSPGTIIERRPLGRTQPAPTGVPTAADARESVERPAANFNVLDQIPVADDESNADDERNTDSAPKKPPVSEAQLPESADTSGPDADAAEDPVALTVQGGNLVLASEDEEALNRLEELVQRLGQVIPPRTKWTVFYLRSADATETAMLLEQLFPTSSVSMTAVDGGLFGGLTSGLSSFGGGLMNAAGLDSFGLDTQTLRIIPDIRSNSLFVSGPPDKVAEIEQVLNVLDSNDLPDSLRDRLPRMIDVKYADVEQVAEIVREVYKDYLQPANAAAMANNPLALLMMGGGSSRGGDRDRREQPQGAIRLTVGVDTSTSKLIVSADEALFQQIKQLVESLDQAQFEAKRTVRVVTLENADASLVQNTLGSLMPKVRTSTTSERRSSSSSSSSSNGSSSSSSSQPSSSSGPSREDQERLQRFMEMRARFGSGDSGRSSSDSSRFSFGSSRSSGGDRGSSRGSRSSSSSDRRR